MNKLCNMFSSPKLTVQLLKVLPSSPKSSTSALLLSSLPNLISVFYIENIVRLALFIVFKCYSLLLADIFWLSIPSMFLAYYSIPFLFLILREDCDIGCSLILNPYLVYLFKGSSGHFTISFYRILRLIDGWGDNIFRVLSTELLLVPS